MQLRDLFKPDLMGNIAIYMDDSHYVVQPCSMNPGLYKYKNIYGGTIWFTGDEEVVAVLGGSVKTYYVKKPEGDIRITKVPCVPATAENLLLTSVMRGV